jgi:ATP-dependent DNA ligase
VVREDERVRLFMRNGNDWTSRFPWIVDAALKNRRKQFVIDGEAVILGVDGVPAPASTAQECASPSYAAAARLARSRGQA